MERVNTKVDRIYKCKRKRCDKCPYEYCIDGDNEDNALMIVAEAKQKRDLEKLNDPQAYWRRYYQRYRKNEIARVRRWQADHAAEHLERQKEYNRKNRDIIEKKRKENDTEAKREQRREYSRNWYKTHKACKQEYARNRYHELKERGYG